jgi:hypothetical protein
MPIFRLTSNVLVQDENMLAESADPWTWADASPAPVADVSRIAHVVNWFSADSASNAVQRTAADTIRAAAARAEACTMDVSLIACVAQGDASAAPAQFRAGAPLLRTVADVGRFQVHRPLPLLFDVLDCGAAAADARGYLVFTNSDICLLPHFYRSVQAILSMGIDCLIVNRRTVNDLSFYGVHPEIAMNDVGQKHPGLDCFVFPAAWVAEFARSNACVGAGWVMRSLLYNLVAKARRMLIMRDAHLTYHFGDDRPWADPKFDDYLSFNLEQARSVLDALAAHEDRRATLSDFCLAHGEPFKP